MPDGEVVPCSVDVYALVVATLESTWPEYGKRERRWMSFRKASELVAERMLAKLLKDYSQEGSKA
jgi:hypothetical protein